ncbi:MAG: hypothetical protein ACI9UQ_002458, partial [Candidatus Krumholzibacteriia bacterium]
MMNSKNTTDQMSPVKEDNRMLHSNLPFLTVATQAIRSSALVGCGLLCLFSTGTAQAQGIVRAWGMGGAGTATSRGLEAVAYNPANLAFSHGTSIGLAAVAVDVHNNAFSLDRYNDITGKYLDSSDKAQVLNDIPDDGLKLDADLNASALGFQTGSFAFSFNGIGAGQGNLDKDYFDLVLNGNQLDQSVDFSNTWGDGYA